MDVRKNDVLRLFFLFFGHERYKLFWGIFFFIMGVPPSVSVVVRFWLTSKRMDYFLHR